jgi:glutamate-1-semialdehyde 2,1-aminomutase
VTDVDGTEYVDYVLSWGALAAGHAHPLVVEAVREQAGRGTSFGAPIEAEAELAEAIVAALPSVEMVRFVSSGSEATMSALRVARAATGRHKIVKFDGCYHGHADALLVKAGSGFRVAWGGAQQLHDVTPDLTCLGKVIGGGLPVAAYGGRSDVMRLVAPSGPVYQAGTLSGNPLSMAAGLASLRVLSEPGTYARMDAMAHALADAAREAGARHGVAVQASAVGGMWGFFLNDRPVSDYADARRSDAAAFNRLFHALLGRGVYVAPSAYEANFLSIAHDDATLAITREALDGAFAALAAGVAGTPAEGRA